MLVILLLNKPVRNVQTATSTENGAMADTVGFVASVSRQVPSCYVTAANISIDEADVI